MTISPDASAVRSRLPRYRRVENYPAISIGRPKHAILEQLARYHYLSAPQLTRLLFSPNSLKYAREHCKELYQASYIERLYLPGTTAYGSPLAVYCLARKGVAYLRRHQLAPEGRFNASEQSEREWYFLKHTLEANELVITLQRFCRDDPTAQLHRFVTERELRRSPPSTRIQGRRVSVIPDGWVHLERQWPTRSAQHYIAFELDRGTIEQRAFRRKVQALAHFIDDGYEEKFGVTGLTIAFVTTHSQKRLNQMLAWAESELERSNVADLFLFAHFDPATIEPMQLALLPIWQQPFLTQTVPLLEPPTEDY